MKHGSLFSGIGGFDLAAEWVGWENIFHCEWDEFGKSILKHYWPKAIAYDDITKTDFTIHRGEIDILSGGDPCQPHSIAGLGKGKADDRFLWPEMYRAIREIQPLAVVNENVDGSVANGIVDLKIDDLEREGYTCQAYDIPAETVGAFHQRERIWIVAIHPDFYAKSGRNGTIQKKEQGQKRNAIQYIGEPVDLRTVSADTDLERCWEQHFAAKPSLLPERLSRYFGFGSYAHGNITRQDAESGIIRMLDGLPEGMDYTGRNKRIKALGNAIVPQVAYEIFKSINDESKKGKGII